MDGARGEFIGIEHLTDRQIGAIRDRLEGESGGDEKGPAAETVERLRRRF